MARSRSQSAFDTIDQDDVTPCAWPGCSESGEHRAPKSRTQINEYQYFCIDHIRDFNKSWNYFEGWNQDEIESYQQADLSWHRKTWRPDEHMIKSRAFREAFINDSFKDPFGFARDEQGATGGKAPPTQDAGTLAEERRALDILDLKLGVKADEIKRRFKEEVKACHPDLNGGDKDAEERLRDVIWAYRRLTQTAPRAGEG
jgi:curved DNA-binding protein CbpA